MFYNLSIRKKLIVTQGSFVLLTFLIAGMAFAIYQRITLEDRARQIMEPYAQLVSAGTDTAIAFEDPVRAQEILNTLRSNPHIMEGTIFLESGRVLAHFGSHAATPSAPPSTQSGIRLTSNMAELRQELTNGAYLRLLMSIESLHEQTRQMLWVFGGIVLLLLFSTLGQTLILQRTIVHPLAVLTTAAERIRSHVDYSHRVPAIGTDEVARLGQSFNSMVEAVQMREGELQDLAIFQHTILNSAAYGIISSKTDGIITGFNPAAERLLGYTADEVVGKQTPALWHDQQEVEQYAVNLSRELGDEIPPGFEVFTARPKRDLTEEHEWTFIRKDGSRVPTNLSVTALRDTDGRITGFVGLVYDLTERKKAEQDLFASEHRMTHTLANMPGFAYTFRRTPDGHLSFPYASPGISAFYGLMPQDVVDDMTPVQMMAHPDDRPRIDAGIAESAKNMTPFSLDFRICRPNMPERWVGVRALPEREPNGSILWYGIMLDIAERKIAEAEIRKLNQELEQRVIERTTELQTVNKELEAFAYSVSHDLRAPLRHIDGFINLLRERTTTALDDKSLHYMDTISDAAKRMGILIDDLLAFSRMGRSEMATAEVDLDSLVQDVLRESEPEIKGRTIDWRIGKLPRVTGDGAMLRMVLVNLISNALKFTRKRASANIEIGSQPGPDKDIIIFVRDNGAGFDMQYAKKLFGVFQRLHKANDFEGTGIGLANVHRIIGRHGGKTWAEGVVDGGATFYFSLPNKDRAVTMGKKT